MQHGSQGQLADLEAPRGHQNTRVRDPSNKDTYEVSLQVTAVKYILKKLDTVSHSDEPFPRLLVA